MMPVFPLWRALNFSCKCIQNTYPSEDFIYWHQKQASLLYPHPPTRFFTLGNQQLVKRMPHSWGLFAWVDHLRHSLRDYIHGLQSTCPSLLLPQKTFPPVYWVSSLPSKPQQHLLPNMHTNTPTPLLFPPGYLGPCSRGRNGSLNLGVPALLPFF